MKKRMHHSIFLHQIWLGEVNQMKFSEAEYIAIHLNIVDRGDPQTHLEIAAMCRSFPIDNTRNQ